MDDVKETLVSQGEMFLEFVMKRIRLHGGAHIAVILECPDGAFETLYTVPSEVWQKGALSCALDEIVEKRRSNPRRSQRFSIGGQDEEEEVPVDIKAVN